MASPENIRSQPGWSRWFQSQWLARLELRDVWFLLLVTAGVVWLRSPLYLVFSSSFQDELSQFYSHIALIPFLCLYLLYLQRGTIFTRVEWSPFLGGILMVVGGTASLATKAPTSETIDSLSLVILSFVVMCWGAFLLCYGISAFCAASFGLGLMVFMVPFPSVFLDGIVGFLQRSSADTVEAMFSVLGIQALREGFTFELSNFVIFIEEECSGIRSFFALLITSLVAGYWFLTSGCARAALVAMVVPLAIIKNTFRIVGLSLLANNVDPAFLLDSVLHRHGGIPLFGLSFVVLISITWLLHQLEHRFKSDQ